MSVDRPQYGEYASPEEQRARAGLPPLEQGPTASAQVPPVVTPGRDADRSQGAAGRLITFVLLGFGLVNVLSSIPGLVDLSSALQQSLDLLGLEGTFTNHAGARTWGVAAAVVMLIGYAMTVWLSVRRIRRARSSWWIPLLGFVMTMIAVSICISVPMLGDPAFTKALLTPPAG
ncbi:DUF6264 family protein [Microbacterium soli]|uniref:Uncharacterized protein n=1 Tax=Microbacterium soli TaxID=446075 RepID=A0ABP7MR10_9MICO